MSEVPFRQLGSSGLNVSVVGVGCNNFGFRIDEDATNAVVAAALDAGLNLFDTADVYGGQRGAPGQGARRSARRGRDRDEVRPSPFETTKHQPALAITSSRRARAACAGSAPTTSTCIRCTGPIRSRRSTRPCARSTTSCSPGKVRYIGSSNFAGWQIADADWTSRTNGWARIVSAQNQYSLVERRVENEVIPACAASASACCRSSRWRAGCSRASTSAEPTVPKARGCSPGSPMAARAATFLNDRNFDKVEALEKVAAEAGVTLLHLAMGGLAAQPAVASVIAGATSPEQIKANVEAGSGCLLPTCSPRSTKPRSERVAHARRTPRRGRGFGRPARRVRSPGGARCSRADVPRVDGRQAVAHQAMVHRWATARRAG